MRYQFKTIHELIPLIAASKLDWQEEAAALKGGHADLLRGPNHTLPYFIAEGYAAELAQLEKAIDDIIGPDPS